MGDDALLASLNIYYDEPKYEIALNAINDTLKRLEQEMTKFAKIRDDQKKVASANKAMNTELTKILKELDEVLGQLNKDSKAFIIHESDKYYQTMESGFEKRWNSQYGGFHGRTIAILNYIDIMANLSENFGIKNIPLLKFIAYNLGSSSPAHGSISTLEEIFTYAAGMIMFDDIALAVQEASKTLKFNNISNIHLYKLQELYFPGSYLLYETANFLKNCPELDPAHAGNAAFATIEVGDNIYVPNYE